MLQSRPFVLRDGAVVALAMSAVVGARFGGGPGLLAGSAVLVLGLAIRRPIVLCLGIAVVAAALADRAMAGLHPAEREPVSGWVTLITDPEPLDSGGVRVDVRLDGRRVEATAFGRPAAMLADRLAGERVQVGGAVRPPPDAAPWLVARRVVGRLAIEDVDGWRPGSLASRAANGLRRTLASGAAWLPRTGRSLLAGVVLGDDREQPPEVTDDFRASGLSHLLAVSGQNVAFVLALAAPALARLRWRSRFPATVAILAAFALVVRFEPSVLRAAAMAAVATLAAALGRPSDGLRVLALAVASLVLVDPLLVRSVGFGLSVGASAAILLLAPRLRVGLPGPRFLAEPLAVTLAAQVGTMPLLLATFGGVPVASVPANLLAVPAAGPLMIWGLTGGLFAGIAPGPLASVLHVPTAALTWWLAAVARWGASLPLGELRSGHAAALAGAVGAWALLRRRWAWAGAVLGVSAMTMALVAALGRPSLPAGSTPIGTGATAWSSRGATVLLVEGPAGAERTLEALRRAGARCVDAVAVAGGGRSAATLAAALLRRCDHAVALAPTGRAHPGWAAIPPDTSVTLGGLTLTTVASGGIRVQQRLGSGGDAAARGPPRAGRRGPAGAGRGVAGGHPWGARARPRRPACRPPGAHGDPGDPGGAPAMTTTVTAPVHLIRGDDPSLVRDAVRRLVDELVGDADRSLAVDEHAGDDDDVTALADAAQTPPFLTDRRVVVGRDLHRFNADELVPLVAYLADPLPTTSLVLVWESGAVPKSLLDAVKKAGGQHVDTSPGRTARHQRSWLAERIAESGLHLDRGAVEVIAETLGADVSRLSGLLESLTATFGPGARLSAADVTPYLGEAGGVPPWELTDAIDRGDIPKAVDLLHRIHAGSHALVVMATLHNHVQRMMALDGSGVRGDKEAAELLGIRGSTFPAKKALDQVRRLGSDTVAQATRLLAQADVDLRGAKAWPDELVLEVLVARLAHLSRR